MANKKRRKAANRPKVASTPGASDVVPQDLDRDSAVEEKAASKAKKGDKKSEKGKEKAVVKSKARAKDPKKAAKKPNIFKRFIEYLKQVRLEIKRTTWPTKSEVLNMTIIVLIALVFFGIFIFIIDYIMVALLNLYAGLTPEAVVDTNLDLSGVDASNPDLGDTGTADLGTDGAETTGGE